MLYRKFIAGRPRVAPPARPVPYMTCDRPPVSIIIPAYNYARFLPEAIESALEQRYELIEVVVVDDGSTDETPQVAQLYGERIRYDRTPNRGLSAARNHGARLATGELIVFLDADNRLDPSFVSDTVAALQGDPCVAFAYTQLRHFGDRAVETQKPPWDPELLRDGNYIDACALIHIDLVRRFPFDESNRIGWEDWDFWLTLAEHGYRGTRVDKPLVEYRRHGEAMTSRIAGIVRLDLRASVLRRHRAYVGRKRWLRAEARRLRQRLGLARRRISRSIGRTA
jgi:glycosyltransferase involved in cell wall biosynthesis